MQSVRPAPHETAHVPALHTCPAGHALPQAPQFALSVARSRQVPPQLVSDVPQNTSQRPSVQTCPAEHTLPQVPQFSLSILVSAQYRVSTPPSTPPQAISVGPHSVAQRPIAQTVPAGQVVPQAPQLARSVSSTTQTPPHAVCPVGQEVWHIPATHTWPVPHAMPHTPQFSRSLCTSTQRRPQATVPPPHINPTSMGATSRPASPPTTGRPPQAVSAAASTTHQRSADMARIDHHHSDPESNSGARVRNAHCS
jgi:hypothetical protein